MSIFVSIAAYRDPQLVPTIEDCLAKARHPEALRFGICWQHGPEEPDLQYKADPRFRIIDVHWRDSPGVCWARAEIMRLWQGEDFFLQLDSHHRFVQDWDAKLLHHFRRTASPKAVISTYATPFTPGPPDAFDEGPMRMNFDRFIEEGIVLFRPGLIQDWQQLDTPVRSRFLSAHFLFAPGEFVLDVPYDPELYFIGEEITLTVRAFTHGYDFFHPPEVIVWHEYTRSYRTKHWDDHVRSQGIEREWHQRDAASKDKIKRFLNEPYVGAFGCGSARSFEDYEAYAGLSFKHRKAQTFTHRDNAPPNPPADPDWAAQTRVYRVPIILDPAALGSAARDDPHFWYVGFHDADDQELFRCDADEAEVRRLLAGPGPIVIEREFETSRGPVSWTVWPFSHSRGWLEQVRGRVGSAC